jgi:hypothetical protein
VDDKETPLLEEDDDSPGQGNSPLPFPGDGSNSQVFLLK